MEGAPDLVAARKVADHLDTIHHEIKFTIQEGIDAIRDVIYHLETYDVTTIRASTPMFLMSRKIKAMGIKMSENKTIIETRYLETEKIRANRVFAFDDSWAVFLNKIAVHVDKKQNRCRIVIARTAH